MRALRALVCLGVVLGPAAANAQKAHRPTPRKAPAHSQRTTTKRTTPTASRAPLAAFSESAGALRDSIVALARAQIGRRYVLGGEQPDSGLDCSGLVRFVMAHFNLKLPRTAAQQAHVGVQVAKDTGRLRPGDLLTFGKGNRASHIGIYVGNGRMVHASTAAGEVVEVPLLRSASPLIKPWRGARRLVLAADSSGKKTEG